MNNLLDDSSWLKKKYIDEQLSLRNICKLTNIRHPNTVKRKLNQLGIKLRGLRASHMVGKEEMLTIDYDVLYGTLLGDGCLCKFSKTDETSPRYSKYSSREDYALHIASCLCKNYSVRVFPVSKKTFDGKIMEGYSFRTLTSELFNPIYNKWYPKWNNYKKIVPKDLILTPRMVLYWFMDDGFSIYRNDSKTKHVVGAFCSESFTKKENEFLCNQLKKFGLSVSVRRSVGIKGTGYRIFLNQSSFSLFLKLIGSCPVKSMEYKWKSPKILTLDI